MAPRKRATKKGAMIQGRRTGADALPLEKRARRHWHASGVQKRQKTGGKQRRQGNEPCYIQTPDKHPRSKGAKACEGMPIHTKGMTSAKSGKKRGRVQAGVAACTGRACARTLANKRWQKCRRKNVGEKLEKKALAESRGAAFAYTRLLRLPAARRGRVAAWRVRCNVAGDVVWRSEVSLRAHAANCLLVRMERAMTARALQAVS